MVPPSPARDRAFVQCDVFTSEPTKGNGLAVVLDGSGLTLQQMQDFAIWTNLAETTFLVPSELEQADYRLRIFSLAGEMKFAGHPTLGSCAAWLHAGGVPKEPGVVRQECGVGIVDIDITGDVPAFAAPKTRVEPLPDARLEAICDAFSLPRTRILRSARLCNGPVWDVIELASADDVLAVRPLAEKRPEFRGVGLIGAHEAGGDADFETRNLGPASSMSEDPITGSMNAAIARWMFGARHWQGDKVIAQGTAMNRLGRVWLRQNAGTVWVGGETQILIEGSLRL